ncbi:MAG: hypothetical protein OER96_09810 [Gammaproteobacteria bacterium]|nr:hypothetical protein [Gammaproteobacteria bacterium]
MNRFLYLLGMGYGLGRFLGDMGGMPYPTFLASGLVASSAMTTASFEGMYFVHTRMVPQKHTTPCWQRRLILMTLWRGKC